MSLKKIRERNSQQFLDDIKRVRDVMVIAPKSNAYLRVTKKDVLKEAEIEKICYYITDNIFRIKRDVMVIM